MSRAAKIITEGKTMSNVYRLPPPRCDSCGQCVSELDDLDDAGLCESCVLEYTGLALVRDDPPPPPEPPWWARED
jgi:hypothetical protein